MSERELHEVMGVELDPIDHIRRKFERYYTETYHHPMNGDWISDDYFRIIDLTTQPTVLDEHEMGRLQRSIDRLNEKYAHIQRKLGPVLMAGYNDVAQQVTTINAADPLRQDIPPMLAAPLEAVA